MGEVAHAIPSGSWDARINNLEMRIGVPILVTINTPKIEAKPHTGRAQPQQQQPRLRELLPNAPHLIGGAGRAKTTARRLSEQRGSHSRKMVRCHANNPITVAAAAALRAEINTKRTED